jgi:hypothetical protein
MWQQMTNLWIAYIEELHQSSSNRPSPDRIQELKTKIRTIHALKPETLAAHREQYFHSNVEDYLKHATIQQMKTYLLNYAPAIQASIREAEKVNSPSILQFPGFSRLSQTPRPPRSNRHTGSRGEPIHHKHHRWRISETTATKFRDFFTPSHRTHTLPSPPPGSQN